MLWTIYQHLPPKTRKKNFFLLLFHWLVFIWNEENLIISWQIKERGYNTQRNETLSHGLHNSMEPAALFFVGGCPFWLLICLCTKKPWLWSHLFCSGKARWGGFWSTSASCWFGWRGWLGNSTRWVMLPPSLAFRGWTFSLRCTSNPC